MRKNLCYFFYFFFVLDFSFDIFYKKNSEKYHYQKKHSFNQINIDIHISPSSSVNCVTVINKNKKTKKIKAKEPTKKPKKNFLAFRYESEAKKIQFWIF